MALKVLVVGAGLGGLCLAQGLRRAGVEVRVFEKGTGTSQDFRLRIDEHGVRALGRCLPPDLLELFRSTCNPLVFPKLAIYDHQLTPLVTWTNGPAPTKGRASAVTNRRTLQEILLAGLDGVVEYGREVVRVDDKGDSVIAHFADGAVETGDVLIAADGRDSVVRGQLFPDAEIVDTELRGIYGHAILDGHVRSVLPESVLGGSSPILGPNGLTLSVGAYQPGRKPEKAAAAIAPYARLSPVDDFVKWTLVGSPATFGVTEEALWTASPEQLYAIALRLTNDWHPGLAHMIARSDATSAFVLSIRAAMPVPAWPTGRITLLGDAIHAATPIGGTGASTTIRDAALLTEGLAEVDAGRADLLDALAAYEVEMRDYGMAAAVWSLRDAERVFRVFIPALD